MAQQRIWHEPRLMEALAQGATVVTASERLARAVQLAFADAQTQAGLRVWETPRVLAWPAFLSEQFAIYQDTKFGSGVAGAARLPQLMSNTQAEALWEQTVRASEAADGLLQPAAAAQAAHNAWSLAQAYRVGLQEVAASGVLDAQQFAAWANAFQTRCEHENWLDLSHAPDRFAELIGAGQFPVPGRLLFAGFDEWSPQQQHLLQTIRDAGGEVERLVMESANKTVARRLDCDDPDHELWTAAQWAGAWLEREPGMRIGIAVRDLSTCREKFARILDQVLCPSAFTGSPVERPYNLSLGRPLANWPVIKDALLFLQFTSDRLDFASLSQLLHSPFLRGAESEYESRIRLERKLREGGEVISLRHFVRLVGEHSNMPILASVLNGCLDWNRHHSQRQLPSKWAHEFAALLQIMGWPGERTSDSVEYQAVEAFREALGELSRLDILLGATQLSDARRRLMQFTTRRMFQPAVNDVPVQVMGIPETAGLQFDHLWVSGLSDDVWPASPRPDPLLPVSLQRARDMPHASAHRELEFAQRVTTRLLGSAPDVVVSVPRRNADQELRPSPLIANLPVTDLSGIPRREVTGYAQFLHASAPTLETLDDPCGPPLQAAGAGGGTGILKAQAACPFQAFARYRLGAEPMPVPGPGLNPAERGSVLHDILQRVWGELHDQAKLAGLDEAAIESLIGRHVAAALAKMTAKLPDVFGKHFIELEQQRLTQVVFEWLQVEKTRQPFEVEQREYQRQIQIGSMTLNTRVDRIDRLGDGSRIIIDYKTGDANPSAWEGERPDEPQLPCYAVTSTEDVAGVLFGILRPETVAYRGLTRTSDVVPGIGALDQEKYPPDGINDWNALLERWRTVLTQLAEGFVSGDARVTPKDRNRTCRYCHLATLCRIDEIQQAGDPDDE